MTIGELATLATTLATIALAIVTGLLVWVTKQLARSTKALEDIARMDTSRNQAIFEVRLDHYNPPPSGRLRFYVLNAGWHDSALRGADFLVRLDDGTIRAYEMMQFRRLVGGDAGEGEQPRESTDMMVRSGDLVLFEGALPLRILRDDEQFADKGVRASPVLGERSRPDWRVGV